MARSIDQQIAEAQAKLARLKTKQKASETRRKIIVGSVVISNALREPEKARALAALLRRAVTREVDQKELVGLLDELDRAAGKAAPRQGGEDRP
jgi:hypothetical protein